MEQFGKFELLSRIGNGGMAEVLLARPADTTLSKLVAIKRINTAHAGDDFFVQLFQREAEIAIRFRHPGIVSVHEFGSIENMPYISMEYLPGQTLAMIIGRLRDDRDAIDVGSKLLIIKTIAEALHYIHEFTDYGEATEIIHRDISPHNILVGFDGKAKLIDFGVARINKADYATYSAIFKGKIAYISPEQALGLSLTRKTDIFSLGIVLWELLCGRKLFTGSTANEISSHIQRGEIPPLVQFAPEVPAELRTISRIALAVDVNDRYKTALEMAIDLERVHKKYFSKVDHHHLSKCMRELFPDEYAEQLESTVAYATISNRSNSNLSDSSPSRSKIFEEFVNSDKIHDTTPSDDLSSFSVKAVELKLADQNKVALQPKKKVNTAPENLGWTTKAALVLMVFGGLLMCHSLISLKKFQSLPIKNTWNSRLEKSFSLFR